MTLHRTEELQSGVRVRFELDPLTLQSVPLTNWPSLRLLIYIVYYYPCCWFSTVLGAGKRVLIYDNKMHLLKLSIFLLLNKHIKLRLIAVTVMYDVNIKRVLYFYFHFMRILFHKMEVRV